MYLSFLNIFSFVALFQCDGDKHVRVKIHMRHTIFIVTYQIIFF